MIVLTCPTIAAIYFLQVQRDEAPWREWEVSSVVASKWREQYERMKRWRRRVQRSRDDPDDVRDNFFAFTQACYHLVDWLEHDTSQPIRHADADQFVEESWILRLCRDICNGSKHARLQTVKKVRDKPVRSGHGTAVWELWVHVNPKESSTAYWFAGLCIAEWDRFLRTNNLLK